MALIAGGMYSGMACASSGVCIRRMVSRPTEREGGAWPQERATLSRRRNGRAADAAQWDYRPLERGWRLGHSEWHALFTSNLRRPWPQHLSAPPRRRPESLGRHEGLVRQLLDMEEQKVRRHGANLDCRRAPSLVCNGLKI